MKHSTLAEKQNLPAYLAVARHVRNWWLGCFRTWTTELSHRHDNLVKRLGCSLVLGLLTSQAAIARPIGEADLLAASLMGEQVAAWLKDVKDRPTNLGIFSVRVNAPLESEFSSVIETEFIKYIRQIGEITVVSCLDCRQPMVKVQDDRLIISKGNPTIESMRDLAKKAGVSSFLSVDVYRTALSMISQVTLYNANTAEVLTTERFKIPALELNDAAVQLMIMGGPGFFFGKTKETETSMPPLGATFLLLEELGFGKGGINFGATFAPGGGILALINPTLGWRGRFGSSALTSLTDFGLGFGYITGGAGPALSGGYTMFLGSIALVSARAQLVIPTWGNKEAGTSGMIGLNMGISLGR